MYGLKFAADCAERSEAHQKRYAMQGWRDVKDNFGKTVVNLYLCCKKERLATRRIDQMYG